MFRVKFNSLSNYYYATGDVSVSTHFLLYFKVLESVGFYLRFLNLLKLVRIVVRGIFSMLLFLYDCFFALNINALLMSQFFSDCLYLCPHFFLFFQIKRDRLIPVIAHLLNASKFLPGRILSLWSSLCIYTWTPEPQPSFLTCMFPPCNSL